MKRIPQNEIYRILSGLAGTVGLYVEDCQSGEIFTINPEHVFPSASVIKVPMLALRDLAKLMIVLSDNIATNEIMDVIGMERFNSFCREMGYQNVRRMGTPEEAFGPTAGRQG